MKTYSIKMMFVVALAAMTTLMALVGIGIRQLGAASDAVAAANQARYSSYLLADEMGQSSDDLTQLAPGAAAARPQSASAPMRFAAAIQ
jgi:methyl-accepting chemotaxis protein